ncbi:MAG: hypothetical protein WCK97_00870 [Actinomycetes bacterium]
MAENEMVCLPDNHPDDVHSGPLWFEIVAALGSLIRTRAPYRSVRARE